MSQTSSSSRSFVVPSVLSAYRRWGRLGVLAAIAFRAFRLRRQPLQTGWVDPVAPRIVERITGHRIRRVSQSSLVHELGLDAARATVLTEDNYPMS